MPSQALNLKDFSAGEPQTGQMAGKAQRNGTSTNPSGFDSKPIVQKIGSS